MNSQKLLTEKQAAEYLGMSRSFLRQGRMAGIRKNCTPAPDWRKIGTRSIRYSIDDLNDWIDSHPKVTPREATEK